MVLRSVPLFRFLLTGFALCALVACDQDDDPVGAAFLVQIDVRDTDGQPVPDLRVSAWNDIPGFMQDGKAAAPAKRRAVTTIRFTVPEEARVTMSTYDAEGELLADLSDGLLPAGVHLYRYAPELSAGTAVVRYTLRGHDADDGSLLFEDSRHAVMNQAGDIDRSEIAVTDADGRVRLRDQRLFPHLYDLPDIMGTDESGDELGLVTISDEVQINLHDPVSGFTQSTTVVVGTGRNLFDIVWNPPPPRADETTPAIDEFDAPVLTGERRDVPAPELEWRLYQNYPNPFN